MSRRNRRNRHTPPKRNIVAELLGYGVVAVAVIAVVILVAKSGAPEIEELLDKLRDLIKPGPELNGELINAGSILAVYILYSADKMFDAFADLLHLLIQHTLRRGLSAPKSKSSPPKEKSDVPVYLITGVLLVASMAIVIYRY